MFKSAFTLIFLLLVIIFISCSTTQQTTTNGNDSDSTEVYVFDDVVEDTVSNQPEISEPIVFEKSNPDTAIEKQVELFIVQIGAYTTRERAQTFVNKHKSKVDYEMNIHFSDKVNLYVVQLPPFRTRIEAETVRNDLWKIEEFKDAFIVP